MCLLAKTRLTRSYLIFILETGEYQSSEKAMVETYFDLAAKYALKKKVSSISNDII